MLWRAEADLVRPRHHLAHVEMDVLAAFGDDAIKRPYRGVAAEQERHGSLATRRIDQGIVKPIERAARAPTEISKTHR